MTILLYIHIGYLINVDGYGVHIAWSPSHRHKPGESIFKHHFQIEFPWWTRPSEIKRRLWIRKIQRKQARMSRRGI